MQTYIFDIAEVVADRSVLPKRWYKFRLLCRDDAKGPVTAICGFNGYLVSSMGQKVLDTMPQIDEFDLTFSTDFRSSFRF